jgi:hypothetical protein
MSALIRSIVFLDAFLPGSGDTMQKLTGPAVRDAIRAARRRGALGVPPRPAQALGVNDADRQWVDGLCVPHPIGTFTSSLALSGAREHVARKTYIRAKGYHNPSFDRAFATVQSDPSWHCHQLPCGHDVMIDLPDRLTELLLQAAA